MFRTGPDIRKVLGVIENAHRRLTVEKNPCSRDNALFFVALQYLGKRIGFRSDLRPVLVATFVASVLLLEFSRFLVGTRSRSVPWCYMSNT